jgi:hypothetical protein
MFSPTSAIKRAVYNRGAPPDSFLEPQITWARIAPRTIAAPYLNYNIFDVVRPVLAPDGWKDLEHRFCALLEAQRVHAMFESSGNWNEGVDVTNATSMKHITGQEAGVFQVSFDSEWLEPSLRTFLMNCGIYTPQDFIAEMKSNHELALEYYSRLVRVNIQWAGPLKDRKIVPYLSIEAMEEYRTLVN